MEQPKNNFKIVSDKKARMLLPNALTLINVCIGLSSIKFALDEKFELSIIAIIFAAIFDALDGRVASAGLIARRIVCESSKDQQLQQGERIGMIRFGSRADVYFENYEPLVKVGQKTIAGETLLAKK